MRLGHSICLQCEELRPVRDCEVPEERIVKCRDGKEKEVRTEMETLSPVSRSRAFKVD